jgi:dTMP kinase
VAFWFDTLTFLISAAIIWLLALPRLSRNERQAEHIGAGASWTQAFSELKEGWRFIFGNPVVRAVNLGLAVGLIGGGMLVPLGPVFSVEVLGAGAPGFGLLTTALGFGVAVGVLAVSVLQKRVPKEQVFSGALVVAGVSLATAASVSWLSIALLAVAVLGVCTGTVYVLGFTLLHQNVSDELRGRIFSALYTLVRLCVLIAFAFGPLLSGLLGSASESLLDDSRFEIGGVSVFVPGVRLTLWLAAAIILGASALAIRSLRSVTTPRVSPTVGGGVSAQGRARADV